MSISSIPYGELCFGIENGDSRLRARRFRQLDVFTRKLLIDPWDADAGLQYGVVRAELRRRGTPIGNNDLLIASHALSIHATLVTNNIGEFQRVPNLVVENWVSE